MNPPILLTYPQPYIAVVMLNRPDISNAVDPAMTSALSEAVANIEANPDIRVAILAAAGNRAFCAGADLKTIAAGQREALYTPSGGFAGFVDASRRKAWIAAIDAPAIGGGLELALACDLIVASRDAWFALPEVKRGMIAAGGGVFRLVRRLSIGIALEMIATGDAIDAGSAASQGLVDHLTDRGKALEGALSIATRIAAAAPIAVMESLAIARTVIAGNVDRYREMTADAARRNAMTSDFVEGPRAFLEKRTPRWVGR